MLIQAGGGGGSSREKPSKKIDDVALSSKLKCSTRWEGCIRLHQGLALAGWLAGWPARENGRLQPKIPKNHISAVLSSSAHDTTTRVRAGATQVQSRHGSAVGAVPRHRAGVP